MNTNNIKKSITAATLLAILPFAAFTQNSTVAGCEYEGGLLAENKIVLNESSVSMKSSDTEVTSIITFCTKYRFKELATFQGVGYGYGDGTPIIELSFSNEISDKPSILQMNIPFYDAIFLSDGTYEVWVKLPEKDTIIKQGNFADIALAETSSLSSISGLWYDPALNGLGFNILSSSNGTMVYY